MALLLSMLPFYIIGNLHCMGMCGPLALMLGQHRYRYGYFLGRLTAFTLAGWVAGELGALLHTEWHLSAAISFLFGGVILAVAASNLLGWHFNFGFKGIDRSLSLLILKDRLLPTYLFGFFTILLPCGQSLVVFSACALAGDPFVGLLNGFAFALITSPSLWLAMHAGTYLTKLKRHANTLLGVCALLVGTLAICRGLADLSMIPHLTLSSRYHIILF